MPTLNQVLRPWWGKLAVGMRYLLLRDGPLSMSMNQGGGFFRTDPSETRPNMQLYFQAFSTVIPKSGERPILTPDPWPGFSIGLSNCRPTSRGSVTIRSSDPRVAAEDRGECLLDQSRRRRDARRGQVPAPHRCAAVDGAR